MIKRVWRKIQQWWDEPEDPHPYQEVWTSSAGQVLLVHKRTACSPLRACPIHAPSNHHMVTWPQIWRGNSRLDPGPGRMERKCPHGIGHPDPDEPYYQEFEGAGIHGCDRCCQP